MGTPLGAFTRSSCRIQNFIKSLVSPRHSKPRNSESGMESNRKPIVFVVYSWIPLQERVFYAPASISTNNRATCSVPKRRKLRGYRFGGVGIEFPRLKNIWGWSIWNVEIANYLCIHFFFFFLSICSCFDLRWIPTIFVPVQGVYAPCSELAFVGSMSWDQDTIPVTQ